MLLSPVSVDTTAQLGFVSSPTSSRGETTGFADQLTSAGSSLEDASVAIPQNSSGRTALRTADTRRRTSQPGEGLSRDSKSAPAMSMLTAANAASQVALFSSAADKILPQTQSSSSVTSTRNAANAINLPASDDTGSRWSATSPGETPLRGSVTQKISSNNGDSPGDGEQLAFAVKVQPVQPLTSASSANGRARDDATTASATVAPPTPGDPITAGLPMVTAANDIPALAESVFPRSTSIQNGQGAVDRQTAGKSSGLPVPPSTSDDSIFAGQPTITGSKDIPVRFESVLGRSANQTAQGSADRQTPQISAGKPATINSEGANGSQNVEVHGARQTRGNSGDQTPGGGNDTDGKTPDKKSPEDGGQSPTQVSAAGGPATAVSASLHADQASYEALQQTNQPAGKQVAPSSGATAIAEQSVAPGQPTTASAPMKDIAVRLETAEGQNVDVRIVQRAGDLRIAVTSADADTTQGLRHGLSELTNRLNESGYHAETWRPGQAAKTSEASAESGSSSHQPPSGNSQSNSGWSQQNTGQRHNNPSNRPRWVQEFDSNLTGAAESTGQFHGIID